MTSSMQVIVAGNIIQVTTMRNDRRRVIIEVTRIVPNSRRMASIDWIATIALKLIEPRAV